MKKDKELFSFIKEYFVDCKPKKRIICYCGETIEFTHLIGHGAYNIVFAVNINNKPGIYKLFVPIRHKGYDDYRFEYRIEFIEKDIIAIQKIVLALPSQIKEYYDMLTIYKESNSALFKLLYNDDFNSFVPKPYSENMVKKDNEQSFDITDAFMVFAYDSYINVEQYLLNCDSIVERLRIIDSIANLVGELYYSHSFFMLDIKFENFLFKSDKKVNSRELKILDWDSIVKTKNGKIADQQVIHSSKGYAPPEVVWGNNDDIGIKSLVYMLGVLLYQSIIMNSKQKLVPPKPADQYDSVEFDKKIDSVFNELNLSGGFQKKFSMIMNECYHVLIRQRYREVGDDVVIKRFSDDIQTLIEIYESKGIHPEVMRDKAMEKFKDFNIDTNLLTDIE